MSILFTQEQIERATKSIAREIDTNPSPTVLVCVLNGAFMFFSDLAKRITINCEIDFIRVKSYSNNVQGELSITKDIELDLKGKRVYLIDDIYETGKTLNFLKEHLSQYNPKEITFVTLFKRGTKHIPNLICGFDLTTDKFIAGYGLDDNGLKRNLPFIFEVSGN